eukprot:774168-Prymnesium_polylepis.1
MASRLVPSRLGPPATTAPSSAGWAVALPDAPSAGRLVERHGARTPPREPPLAPLHWMPEP